MANEKVMLVFPTPDQERLKPVFGSVIPQFQFDKMLKTERTVETDSVVGKVGVLSTNVEEIAGWFKTLRVDKIELWVTGGVKTGEITSLFVSANGEAGIKLTLKPLS